MICSPTSILDSIHAFKSCSGLDQIIPSKLDAAACNCLADETVQNCGDLDLSLNMAKVLCDARDTCSYINDMDPLFTNCLYGNCEQCTDTMVDIKEDTTMIHNMMECFPAKYNTAQTKLASEMLISKFDKSAVKCFDIDGCDREKLSSIGGCVYQYMGDLDEIRKDVHSLVKYVQANEVKNGIHLAVEILKRMKDSTPSGKLVDVFKSILTCIDDTELGKPGETCPMQPYIHLITNILTNCDAISSIVSEYLPTLEDCESDDPLKKVCGDTQCNKDVAHIVDTYVFDAMMCFTKDEHFIKLMQDDFDVEPDMYEILTPDLFQWSFMSNFICDEPAPEPATKEVASTPAPAPPKPKPVAKPLAPSTEEWNKVYIAAYLVLGFICGALVSQIFMRFSSVNREVVTAEETESVI